MSQDNFQWTDELVKEFQGWYLVNKGKFEDHLREFKYLKTKRDWEITGFVVNAGIGEVFFHRKENGLFGNVGGGCFSEDEMLCHYKIRSVKRLSDGEVFSIGDEVDYKTDNNTFCGNYFGIIQAIKISRTDSREVCFEITVEGEDYHAEKYIRNIRKRVKPKPLFVTEDGVEIRNGDSVWYCDINDWSVSVISNLYDYRKEDGYLYFSTKEVAESYVVVNKPLFSVNECIKAMLDSTGDSERISGVMTTKILKDWAKEKLSK